MWIFNCVCGGVSAPNPDYSRLNCTWSIRSLHKPLNSCFTPCSCGKHNLLRGERARCGGDHTGRAGAHQSCRGTGKRGASRRETGAGRLWGRSHLHPKGVGRHYKVLNKDWEDRARPSKSSLGLRGTGNAAGGWAASSGWCRRDLVSVISIQMESLIQAIIHPSWIFLLEYSC